MTVLLNGIKVDGNIINPKEHKFIGMFRFPLYLSPDAFFLCDCGNILQTIQATKEHWVLGHMDIPQYIDIKND